MQQSEPSGLKVLPNQQELKEYHDNQLRGIINDVRTDYHKFMDKNIRGQDNFSVLHINPVFRSKISDFYFIFFPCTFMISVVSKYT